MQLRGQYGSLTRKTPWFFGDEVSSVRGVYPGASQVGCRGRQNWIRWKGKVRTISFYSNLQLIYLSSLGCSLELTSEELTAKRRAERKQFKLDRAKAIAAAAATAEAAFAEGRVITPALSGPTIPSAATWKPSALTEAPELYATAKDVDLEAEEPPEDIEHLQLTLPEAFFLLWTLDGLTIIDPHTVSQ
jgi:hypothetical protein